MIINREKASIRNSRSKKIFEMEPLITLDGRGGDSLTTIQNYKCNIQNYYGLLQISYLSSKLEDTFLKPN